MTWRVVLTACIALVLALGIRWLVPTDRSATPPMAVPDTRFDYTLTDFSARFRDAENEVDLMLSGPRLEHISAERVAHVEAPEFHIEPTRADWRGSARRARVLRDEEVLILEGQVELAHGTERGELRVQAERLRYDRGARTISSDTEVDIAQGRSWLSAGGLIIRLDDNILDLTHGLQGELAAATARDSRRRADAGDSDG